MSEFSEILKATIKLRGMKYMDLCEKCGIDPSVMTRYIQGTMEPKIGRAVQMARALDVSVDYLVGNSADDPRADLFEMKAKQLELRAAEIAEELETLQREIRNIRDIKRWKE